MKKLLIALIISICAIASVNATPAHAAGRLYVVQAGDTLFSIAARFNVSVSELATINRIYDVNSLVVGQVLTLPDPLPTGGAVVAQPAAPLPGSAPNSPVINTTYPTTNAVVPSYSYQPFYTPPVYFPTYANGTTVTTVTTYTSYIVRPGDTLADIAARLGTTQQAVMSANAISNPDLVFAGQLLTIPKINTTVSPQPRVIVQPRVAGNVYIVQPGDNLFSIAARTGRNAWSIASANGILDLNAIFVGEPLIIP